MGRNYLVHCGSHTAGKQFDRGGPESSGGHEIEHKPRMSIAAK